MDEIREKILEVFKTVEHQCAKGNCDSCKYSSLLNCNDYWIIDKIMDKFIVAEKIKEPISDVIFVEDGSADIDELQKQFGDNVPIIIYRQGGAKPEIQHLACPITPEFLKKETESK